MKIAVFDDNRLGLVREDRVHDVTAALSVLPATERPWLSQTRRTAAGAASDTSIGRLAVVLKARQ